MSRKTRKLIWLAPVMAVFAIASALAIFAATTPNEAQADHIELPGPPQNVMAEADGARAINLTWDAPADDGGSAITGYRIDYLDMASGNIWRELVASTTGTSHTDDDGLEPEEERAYRVFAINALGTGSVSDVVFEATDEAGTATPGQVITFNTPVAVGPTQINLRWAAPAKTGDTAISSYRIHIARTADTIPAADAATVTKAADVGDLDLAANAATAVIDTGSDATSYSLMGLRARQTWHFQIYARNDDGNSTAGSPVRTQTTGDPIAPASPTDVRAVSTDTDGTGTGAVRLYWYWPAHDGGADISRFRVEVRQSGKAWPSSTTAAAGDLTGLTGTAGNAVTTVTPNTSVTQGFEYEHTGIDDSLDGKVLQYRVFTETTTGPTRRSSESNMTSATVDGGNSIAGATDVAATAGPGTLSLNWTAPAGAGTGYLIDYAEGPESGQPLKWMRLERNTIFSSLPYLHDDPMAGTSYHYRVFAHPIRRGLASNVSPAATPTTPAQTVPEKPMNLTGTVVNAGQIDLDWDAPKDGGDPITTYHVHLAPTTGTLDPAGALTDTDSVADGVQPPTDFEAGTAAVLDTKSADTMYSLKGLRSQQTWQIAVVAHNGQTGTNVLSDIIIVTMPVFEQPAMPVGLVAESAIDSNLLTRSKRGVLLIWNHPAAPDGAEINKYEIERMVNDGDFEDLVTLDAATGATDPLSTFYTDASEPKDDEIRAYRVRTVAKATTATDAAQEIKSDWATVRYPADTSHMEPLPLVAPDSVTAMLEADDPNQDDVIVTWTGGSGPEGTKFAIGIFTRDFSTFLTDRVVNDATGGTHKFDDLPPGEYVIVVATYDPAAPTVGMSTRSNPVTVGGN